MANAFCDTHRHDNLTADCIEYESVFGSPPGHDNSAEPDDIVTVRHEGVIQGKLDPWFRAMKSFAKKDPTKGHASNVTPIRVAILDTGIDMSFELFQRRVEKRKAFVQDTHDFLDLDGYGTHVAGLVLQVAPDAKLLIARITGDRGRPTPAAVQEAIAWAVKNDADIINCSWGFKETPKPDPMRTLGPDLIVFAAVDNSGQNTTRYPWPARHGNVFPIGTSNDAGKRWDYSQHIEWPPGPTVLLLPGCNITSHFPSYLGDGSGKRSMSGTSMSTAIASGLAARILHYAAVCNRLNDSDKKNAIKEALRRMCVSQSLFVGAWAILEREATDLVDLEKWLSRSFE
ncbi:subtilisin-like protein [Morchella conica CCBAS932]|uniref:Subtilisin-like protein n=1 Tax=Morchella conica CCBAS932 TaxID=1392247 RepID=A0A3N4KAN9_9PEZI|nr:subtilisin-like protein [Morchella conica CCBAS932]